MNNNLKRIEKELRSFVKRCKDIKYNTALLFSFLVTGSLSLSANGKDDVETAKRGLQTSITDMKKLFKEAKAENDKLMKGSNLELVQLMEQGDHVVKSPWSSWQFGINEFYNNWRGNYKGHGDKTGSVIFQRNSNLSKYSYQTEGIFKYGDTSITLGNALEKLVEIGVDASLRTLSIDKEAPNFVPTTPSGGLPPFDPLMVTPPIINPKNVNISQVPSAPPTDVAYQNVPNWTWGYNVNNPLQNNALIAQVEVLSGTFNNYFSGVGDPLKYNFSGATENGAYTPSNDPGTGTPVPHLPASDAGDSNNTAAFYALSGKVITLPNTMTVNVVGNNSSGGDLNSIYYMGNPSDSGNAEAKLIHKANTNIYGNKIAVVNIDNVASTGGITFVNRGNIIGHAQNGTFVDASGTALTGATPGNHIFGAYSYGTSESDKIENASDGSVIFYAPESVGWAYSSGNT